MMDQLKKEVEENYNIFNDNWRKDMLTTSTNLSINQDKFLKSYTRLVTLQTWRSFLETRISSDSLGFFLEAQNDGLVSHVLANLGSWRSALKSLRGCIDNVLFSLYYMDHPVELALWHQGSHKLGFAELLNYFEKHPQIKSVESPLTGLMILHEEYSTLSRAVHGSARSFRMTVDSQSTLLWSDTKASLGAWSTREQATIYGINLLLLAMFREHIQGTSSPQLRNVVSLLIPTNKYAQIKRGLGVTLIKT